MPKENDKVKNTDAGKTILIKYCCYNNPGFSSFAEAKNLHDAEVMIEKLLLLNHVTSAEIVTA